jgi:hypothetical protein
MVRYSPVAWLCSANMVLSPGPGFTQRAWYSRTAKVVLFHLDTLLTHGYAPGIWYCPRKWLRSRHGVLS